ncbi:YvrJ family protein [Peribacillus deserti]|uniref:YvrJ family protein n=1 Tax=Peribacillus deserti TaxID=673318 RepID=A0A2N5M2I7_9BACI|nr:YvrJ family protein [Peribacillus deserti]PLT28586.1 YvrJ family protein [Peribacillus deserti]
METLFTFISEVGFPIVVSLYLLYRIESKLDILIQSIQNLPPLLKDKPLP